MSDNIFFIAFVAYGAVFIYLTMWELVYVLITPQWLYDKGLNWFGSFLVFVLLSIFSPFCAAIKLFLVICMAVKWLLTVGR